MSYTETNRPWYEEFDPATLERKDRYEQMAIDNEKYLDRKIKAERKYHVSTSTGPRFDANKDIRTLCETLGIPYELRGEYLAFAKKKASKKSWTPAMQLIEVFGFEGSGFQITLTNDRERGWRTDPTRLTEQTQHMCFLESPCVVTKADGTTQTLEPQLIDVDTSCKLDEYDIEVCRWGNELDIVYEKIDLMEAADENEAYYDLYHIKHHDVEDTEA